MSWSIKQSCERYNLDGWSDGYFDIGRNGHLMARPNGQRSSALVDLHQLAGEIKSSGLNWPVLVRCGGIIRDRVDRLINAFSAASGNNQYQGRYTAVYPIKVNQQFSVVRQILDHGGDRVGLEAGSKPELMAVLGLSQPGGLIVCNGYKDREYIRLALIASSLGQRIYLVVEKLSELEEILRQSRDIGVTPLLGVRVRLASIGAGNWQNSGGTKSKFGLHAAQVLTMVETLKEHGLLESLQLLHFHLGSQLASLSDIASGVDEAARFYSELSALGVPVKCMDVGGGLGVDYEGTASRNFCSMNYSLQQYAEQVVSSILRVCEENKLPHPEIITESGRAMTAHHAFLITNVIDTEQTLGIQAPDAPDGAVPDVLSRLEVLYRQLESGGGVLDAYRELATALEEMQGAYVQGLINLRQRARGEAYYYAAIRRVRNSLDPARRDQRVLLDELNEKLADKYFCNLSIFKSLPDVWGIDQIFPIVPLQRLDEEPDRRARIEDLTCDSDGRIDYYVDGEGIENSLPLHAMNVDDPYLLGFFMVGAYQEILGDMHNLFGDTDTVNLEICEDGSYELCQAEHGDRADEVLSYVHFTPDRLRASYRQKVQAAGLEPARARQYMAELEAGLSGYTYHED